MLIGLLSSERHLNDRSCQSVKSRPFLFYSQAISVELNSRSVCARLCILRRATVHNVASGALCQQVCVKTSFPPTSSLRALNSCRKLPAVVQTCGGTERLPISHLSVSVVSSVSHTLRLFTGPREGNNRSVSCYTSH